MLAKVAKVFSFYEEGGFDWATEFRSEILHMI